MTTPYWTSPTHRYYYPWYMEPQPATTAPPSDHAIKSDVVDRLRENVHTKDYDIKVDVEQRVVILGGRVGSELAKRVAGDEAWDSLGVRDVSNQLEIVRG